MLFLVMIQLVMLFPCFLTAANTAPGCFAVLRTNASHTLITDTSVSSPAGRHYYFFVIEMKI